MFLQGLSGTGRIFKIWALYEKEVSTALTRRVLSIKTLLAQVYPPFNKTRDFDDIIKDEQNIRLAVLRKFFDFHENKEHLQPSTLSSSPAEAMYSTRSAYRSTSTQTPTSL
jgi:hypothetical protein